MKIFSQLKLFVSLASPSVFLPAASAVSLQAAPREFPHVHGRQFPVDPRDADAAAAESLRRLRALNTGLSDCLRVICPPSNASFNPW